jgi:hypothetical protein
MTTDRQFHQRGWVRQTFLNADPKIELDQLSRKLDETKCKMFSIVPGVTNDH